ncbi:MAG: SPOR domain-containing protein [Desulfotignum sp.]|nr:SPOR domain-containing protein [Desulfobacteraceae bacterium]
MIWYVRNISVRLWVTTLLVIPFCFYVMPGVRQIFPGMGFVLFALGVGAVCYGIVDFLMHFFGRKLIQKLIREAEMWERAAIHNRSQKKYFQAVRIYDSFLLSPLSVGKINTRLTGALARFSLTFDRENGIFRQAPIAYLQRNLWDDTLAALWLKRLCTKGAVGDQEQDLLTRLADIHHANMTLVPLLTRLFLHLERLDFAAKQIYARAMEDAQLQKEYGKKIHLLLKESLQIFDDDAAYPVQNVQPHSISFIDRQKVSDLRKPLFTGIRYLVRYVWMLLVSGWGFVRRYFGLVVMRIQTENKWRVYLKAGALGVLSLGLLVFVYNTISHLQKSKAVDEVEVIIEKIEKKVPKPFTIQVAAYLKQSHADQYLKVLKQEGIAARIKKTDGGGKTWYLIQVSEFTDRAAATAYGNQLKAQNLIEDFFVSNT